MPTIDLLLSPGFAPFSAALAIVMALFVVEVLLTVAAGCGFSDLMTALVDSHSLPDTSFTNWLMVREVPLLMALLALLFGFGVTGVALQSVAIVLMGATLPLWAVGILAGLGGLLSVRLLTLVFNKLKFTNSSALMPEEFIGQTVTLINPVAYQGYAGAASFTDRHGYTHTVMLEPVNEGEAFVQGESLVLLARLSASLFSARRARSGPAPATRPLTNSRR